MLIIHNKNPSGFHNKIKWVLKHCHRKINELDEMQILCPNNFYNKDKDYNLVKVSWDIVFKIVRFIITKEVSNVSFKGDREHNFIKKLSLNEITKRKGVKNAYGVANTYIDTTNLDTYLENLYTKCNV